MTSLAFPPADLGFLVFVGLVPVAIGFSRSGGAPTFWTTLGFAAAFLGLLIPWMRLFGNIAYLALVVQQVFMIVAGLLIARLMLAKAGERAKLVLFPFAFLAVEYLRSHVPYGGFPWGGIGYSQHDSPYLLEVSSYAGVWGVTLLVAGVSAAIAALLISIRPARLPRAIAAALAAGLLIAAPALLPVGNPAGKRIRVAMVQGNASEFVADPHIDDEEVLLNHVEITRRIPPGSADLVVWPESALGRDPFADPEFLDLLTESIHEQGVPFLVGATIEIAETEEFLNTTLFMSAEAEVIDRYEKIRLVPFGEYVPFRSVLEPWVQELRRVPFDGVPGSELTLFDLPSPDGGRVASVICFESTFPGFVRKFIDRGGQFLVVSTNNSSFERSAASEQHLAFSQLRAAEHRIWVTHVALTGISAVIGPDGTVLERTELFKTALLQPEIRLATTKTFYGRTGDWLPVLSLVLVPLGGVGGLIAFSRKGRRV